MLRLEVEDWFEIAGEISRVLMKKVDENLVSHWTRLLSTDLNVLQRSGIPVDRLLKVKVHFTSPCPIHYACVS